MVFFVMTVWIRGVYFLYVVMGVLNIVIPDGEDNDSGSDEDDNVDVDNDFVVDADDDDCDGNADHHQQDANEAADGVAVDNQESVC